MVRMNRSLLVLASLLAATAAQAQDAGRRTYGTDRMAIEQPAPAPRAQRDTHAPAPRRHGDQYILHDRATRKATPGDSGYGLDLMMTPRRPAPGMTR